MKKERRSVQSIQTLRRWVSRWNAPRDKSVETHERFPEPSRSVIASRTLIGSQWNPPMDGNWRVQLSLWSRKKQINTDPDHLTAEE